LSVTPVVSPPLGETTGPPPPSIDEPGVAGAPAVGAPGAPAAPSAGVVSPGAATAAAPAVPALVPGRALPAATLPPPSRLFETAMAPTMASAVIQSAAAPRPTTAAAPVFPRSSRICWSALLIR